MTITYSIGGKQFASRKDLVKYIHSIFEKYPVRTPLDKNDFDFACDLLRHHPEANEKIGCGIDTIITDTAAHGTTCFYLQRTDGTKDDFSYLSCIKNY